MSVLWLSFSAASTLYARSWRVNNDLTKRAHFADINAAMASSDVCEGDTLYLDPGCSLTGKQEVTKQVTILGTGYLFDQPIFSEAVVVGNIYLRAAGTKVEALKVTGTVYMSADDIVVERCCLKYVRHDKTAKSVTIRQCYLPNGNIEGAGSSSAATSNWRIENCIIIYKDGYDPVKNLYCPTVCNNYISPKSGSASLAYIDGATVLNNIFINPYSINNANLYYVTNSTVSHNIFHIASYATTYPDNIIIDSNTEGTVFALEGTNEQRYRLKEDSPARGAAQDGGDCGPYGGLFPYVPSGYALGLPRFEHSSVPIRPEEGIVRISQKVVVQAE